MPNFMAQSASIRLVVPHIRGIKAMSCWHDAARMIFQYKKRADINPLPKNEDLVDSLGLNEAMFVELARELGMEHLPVPPATYSVQFLADALTKYGPLWAAGDWNGFNHVIVITGVTSAETVWSAGDGTVYINDPAYALPQVRNMTWFNEHICTSANVPISILYLP